MTTFSERHGLPDEEPDITVRHDAPPKFRGFLPDIAFKQGLTPQPLRSIVCDVLMVEKDSSNWSEYPNIYDEIKEHLNECPWYEVYDICEAIYASLENMESHKAMKFEEFLNKYFRKNGIGWKMETGLIDIRGSHSFEDTLKTAHRALESSSLTTASAEIDQALKDLSRRPKADVTGALQHSLAALECVARSVTGDPKATLGHIISKNRQLVPAPLDRAVEKLWGYASERGRHLREGELPSFDEAQLAVSIAAALCTYLAKDSKSGKLGKV